MDSQLKYKLCDTTGHTIRCFHTWIGANNFRILMEDSTGLYSQELSVLGQDIDSITVLNCLIKEIISIFKLFHLKTLGFSVE